MSKAKRYFGGKAGAPAIHINMPYPPKNSTGKYGQYNDTDGIYIEWDNAGISSIVLLKDGIRHAQTMHEFIENAKK